LWTFIVVDALIGNLLLQQWQPLPLVSISLFWLGTKADGKKQMVNGDIITVNKNITYLMKCLHEEQPILNACAELNYSSATQESDMLRY